MSQLATLESLVTQYRIGAEISLRNGDLISAYNFCKIMINCLPKGYKSKLRGNLSKKTLKDLIRRNEKNIKRLRKKQFPKGVES